MPAIGVGYEFDDNALLFVNTVSSSPAQGPILEAEAELIYKSQLTDFSLIPKLQLSRYDESVLDADNYFLDMSYRYTGQRSTFDVSGSYGDESVRTAERADVDLDVDNPDQIPDDNSGQVLSVENRQRLQFRPRWSLRSGERSRVRLGVNYIDVKYDESNVAVNTDYEQIAGETSYEFDFSERTVLNINGYYRENYFSQQDGDFTGYGATLGMIRRISERTSLIANIGMDSTEFEVGEKDNNAIGNVAIAHTGQASQVFASFRRSISGSGSGVLAVRDSVDLAYTQQLNAKFSIGGGIAGYTSKALGQTMVSFEDRTYLQLRVSTSWNFTRVLSLDLDYRYTYLDRDTLPAAADSNRVNIWLRYQAFK